MRKFDSPKNRLLPPDAAATEAPVTTAGVLGDGGPDNNGAVFRALPGLLTETGLDEAGWEPDGTRPVPLDSAPSEDSSLMLGWRGFRRYLPLFDGKTTQSVWLVSQLLQGTFSITSHFTLRRLHSLQACLARDRLLLAFISSLVAFSWHFPRTSA